MNGKLFVAAPSTAIQQRFPIIRSLAWCQVDGLAGVDLGILSLFSCLITGDQDGLPLRLGFLLR